MDFDATKPFTEAAYNAFIDWLTARTVAALRDARASGQEPDEAIKGYLLTAYRSGISMGEACDFFCISTPSIAESAGYSGPDLERIARRFDDINAAMAPQFFR